jgi:phospholipase/carboxylesterase
MNRLALDTEIASVTSSPAGFATPNERISRRFRDERRETGAPHTTFTPVHYEKNYAYPLVVWLHGTAGNEHELRQVMPLVSMRNYVGVAPRGTWIDPRKRGRYGWRQDSDSIELAQARIASCVSLAKQRFNIHEKRIFLVGHGSGGTMAVRVAWNEPHRYAGAVAINGPLPTRFCPLHRVNEIRRIPCLLASSRESGTYPDRRVCSDLRLLHAAGCTVALRIYPGGDELTTTMLSDLNRWLMELVCGTMHEPKSCDCTFQ